MKKIKFILSISILLSFVFTGCFNPVFYEVRKDVPPEKATINGPISSITRYSVGNKEYLVTTANDGIKYKLYDNHSHGGWIDYNSNQLPFNLPKYDYFDAELNGEQIIKVLADSDTLYLVSATYRTDLGILTPDVVSIWAIQIQPTEDGNGWRPNAKSDWRCILRDTEKRYFKFYADNYYHIYHSAFNIFQTNSPIKSHRNVYLRCGKASSEIQSLRPTTYYKLNGLNENFISNPITITPFDASTSEINSAAYFNGEILFFNSQAVTTNETYTNDATYFYYGVNSELFYNENAGSKASVKKALDAKQIISSITFTNNAILIGRGRFDAEVLTSTGQGGIAKTTVTNGVPGSSLVSFTTNAEFQITNAYYVPVLFNATPDRNELDSYLYASVVIIGADAQNSDNVGLWSYYPQRGNWNRE